ncbi:unnamed protein product, partial [Symbiodinium sp. CCMP2456]
WRRKTDLHVRVWKRFSSGSTASGRSVIDGTPRCASPSELWTNPGAHRCRR